MATLRNLRKDYKKFNNNSFFIGDNQAKKKLSKDFIDTLEIYSDSGIIESFGRMSESAEDIEVKRIMRATLKSLEESVIEVIREVDSNAVERQLRKIPFLRNRIVSRLLILISLLILIGGVASAIMQKNDTKFDSNPQTFSIINEDDREEVSQIAATPSPFLNITKTSEPDKEEEDPTIGPPDPDEEGKVPTATYVAPTATQSPTDEPTSSAIPTASSTQTPDLATATASKTPTKTETPSDTPTDKATDTQQPSQTSEPENTDTPTSTNTPTNTPSLEPDISTPSATVTKQLTNTPIPTANIIPPNTQTPSLTPTFAPTVENTITDAQLFFFSFGSYLKNKFELSYNPTILEEGGVTEVKGIRIDFNENYYTENFKDGSFVEDSTYPTAFTLSFLNNSTTDSVEQQLRGNNPGNTLLSAIVIGNTADYGISSETIETFDNAFQPDRIKKFYEYKGGSPLDIAVFYPGRGQLSNDTGMYYILRNDGEGNIGMVYFDPNATSSSQEGTTGIFFKRVNTNEDVIDTISSQIPDWNQGDDFYLLFANDFDSKVNAQNLDASTVETPLVDHQVFVLNDTVDLDGDFKPDVNKFLDESEKLIVQKLLIYLYPDGKADMDRINQIRLKLQRKGELLSKDIVSIAVAVANIPDVDLINYNFDNFDPSILKSPYIESFEVEGEFFYDLADDFGNYGVGIGTSAASFVVKSREEAPPTLDIVTTTEELGSQSEVISSEVTESQNETSVSLDEQVQSGISVVSPPSPNTLEDEAADTSVNNFVSSLEKQNLQGRVISLTEFIGSAGRNLKSLEQKLVFGGNLDSQLREIGINPDWNSDFFSNNKIYFYSDGGQPDEFIGKILENRGSSIGTTLLTEDGEIIIILTKPALMQSMFHEEVLQAIMLRSYLNEFYPNPTSADLIKVSNDITTGNLRAMFELTQAYLLRSNYSYASAEGYYDFEILQRGFTSGKEEFSSLYAMFDGLATEINSILSSQVATEQTNLISVMKNHRFTGKELALLILEGKVKFGDNTYTLKQFNEIFFVISGINIWDMVGLRGKVDGKELFTIASKQPVNFLLQGEIFQPLEKLVQSPTGIIQANVYSAKFDLKVIDRNTISSIPVKILDDMPDNFQIYGDGSLSPRNILNLVDSNINEVVINPTFSDDSFKEDPMYKWFKKPGSTYGRDIGGDLSGDGDVAFSPLSNMTVFYKGTFTGLGPNTVILKSINSIGKNTETGEDIYLFMIYGHMRGTRYGLEIGDTINGGNYIGLIGDLGNATGKHLDFSVLAASESIFTENVTGEESIRSNVPVIVFKPEAFVISNS